MDKNTICWVTLGFFLLAVDDHSNKKNQLLLKLHLFSLQQSCFIIFLQHLLNAFYKEIYFGVPLDLFRVILMKGSILKNSSCTSVPLNDSHFPFTSSSILMLYT